jgi:hypothetical protein
MSRQSHEYRREIGRKWLHDAVLHGSNMVEWCYRAKNGDEILSEAIATLVPLTERDVIMVQFRDIAREEQIPRDEEAGEPAQGIHAGLRRGRGGAACRWRHRIPERCRAQAAGCAPGQNPPKNFVEQCLPDSRDELLELLTLALPDAISFPLRYQIMRKDGAVRWHHAVCRYIEIENDLKGHLLHFRDITEQVEAEEARRRDQAALEYLARHNAMGEMATAIAHELSQPLAAIRNFLEGSVLRLKQIEALREQTGQIVWGLESAGRQVDHAATIIKSVREYVVRLEQSEDADRSQRGAGGSALVHRDEGRRGAPRIAPRRWWSAARKGQVILNLAFNAIEEMGDFPKASGACASARPGRPGWRG